MVADRGRTDIPTTEGPFSPPRPPRRQLRPPREVRRTLHQLARRTSFGRHTRAWVAPFMPRRLDYTVPTGSHAISNFWKRGGGKDSTGVNDEEHYLPPVTWYPETEKELVRKLDWRILPLIWLMGLIALINLANVKILGAGTPDSIETSIGTQSTQWNWAISLLNWGKALSGRVWLSRIILSWGIVVICMAFITNPAGLLTTRFILGLCEAGLSPGVFYNFAFWYKPTERATCNPVYLTSISLAGGLSGQIADGIERVNGIGGLKAWQWVFIIEGIPAVLLGIVWYLPEFPHSKTSFLPSLSQCAVRRLPATASTMHDRTFDLGEALTLFMQPAQWLFMFSFFCLNFGSSGFDNFIPSILLSPLLLAPKLWDGLQNPYNGEPHERISQFLSIPYMHSDYTRERVWHGLLGPLLTTVCVSLLVTAAKNPPTETSAGFMPNWARYLLIFGVAFQSATHPILINYRQSTLKGATQVGLGISSIYVFQTIASIASPFLFPNSDAPLVTSYVNGLTIAAVVFGLCTLFYGLIPLALRYQNNMAQMRLDRERILVQDSDEKLKETLVA
ncbi:MFS general substrate transporter [Gonapodya prolifera JEL478]|uniref:MFS general substrate transporter n=1 Tax=Gonapodya prolifera (strain JEL478) TaxID=1344416 RepID=A0A139A8M3_GONPJ|nr:MFS general substrate transporter [Gonapodya prolifera JEL478]|eukprot:KXS13142.1 MFS general substrate transporter [Gonapodya prolifera JEL478]